MSFDIIVTGDILRPWFNDYNSSHQKINIQYVTTLFNSIFDKFDTIFPEEPFYNTYEEWVKTDRGTIHESKLLSIIKEKKYKNPFVIGFELPRNSIIEFIKNDIKYLDFYISPIRFNGDIISFDTNLNVDISKFWVDERELYTKAKSYTPCKISKNSALIIGQVKEDRSLLRNGRLVKLMDYEDILSSIGEEYNLIYKPHPLDMLNNLDLIKRIGAEESYECVYNILSSPKIELVIGISSSVLYECKYFEKDALFLNKRWQCKNRNMVYKNVFFSKQFFKEVLNVYSI